MYRITEIVNSFKTLVGWEQSQSNARKIEASLTQSDSGLYFQEAHPMLTLRAMESVMPNDWEDKYPEYAIDETYSKGDKVISAGKVYKSLVNNNIGHSVLESSYWAEFNVLSDYLESLSIRGIKKAIQRFVRDKMVGLESKSIIDRRCLFDGTGRINDRIERQHRVCGYEITPLHSNGVTMVIDKIGLQFVGNVGDVKVYLFHSSKREPIATKTLSYTSTLGTYQWFDVSEFVLPYITANTNAGGSWYIVYEEDSLPAYMEAVNFAKDWSREPCGTCNRGDAKLWNTMLKYVEVSPFYAILPEWDKKLWDIADNIYTNTRCYGLNLQFSLLCDLTDTLISLKKEFANIVQLQVASDALRTLALNPEVEVNRVQYNADRDQILYETDGNGQGVRGLNGELEKAYKALSIDTKGLDPICLGCHNKGIRIGSI